MEVTGKDPFFEVEITKKHEMMIWIFGPVIPPSGQVTLTITKLMLVERVRKNIPTFIRGS